MYICVSQVLVWLNTPHHSVTLLSIATRHKHSRHDVTTPSLTTSQILHQDVTRYWDKSSPISLATSSASALEMLHLLGRARRNVGAGADHNRRQTRARKRGTKKLRNPKKIENASKSHVAKPISVLHAHGTRNKGWARRAHGSNKTQPRPWFPIKPLRHTKPKQDALGQASSGSIRCHSACCTRERPLLCARVASVTIIFTAIFSFLTLRKNNAGQ